MTAVRTLGDVRIPLFLVFCWLGLLAWPVPAEAQLQQLARAEFAADNQGEDHQLLVCEDSSLVVVRRLYEYRKGNNVYNIWRLDTALDVAWSLNLEVSYRMNFVGYASTPEYYYMLFSRVAGQGFQHQVVQLNLQTAQVTHLDVDKSPYLQLEYFEAFGQSVVIGGYDDTERPVALVYDLVTSTSWTVPNLYDKRLLILDLDVDQQRQEFHLLLRRRLPGNFLTVELVTYNQYGDLVRKVEVQPDEKISLLDGGFSMLSLQRGIIMGTYARRRSRYSRGIFVASIGATEQRFVSYIGFGELENFFGYMRERRRRRVEARTERRLAKGKDPRLNYRMIFHEVEEVNGEYVAVVEAFRPEYDRQGSPYFGNYGRMYNIPTSSGELYLIGLDYTHAVVLGVDDSGILAWDNVMDTKTILARDMKQYVHWRPMRSGAQALMYAYDKHLVTKVINGVETLEGQIEHEQPVAYEKDKLGMMNANAVDVQDWYGPYFLMAGEQNISNLFRNDGQDNRRIFVVSKLRYD